MTRAMMVLMKLKIKSWEIVKLKQKGIIKDGFLR